MIQKQYEKVKLKVLKQAALIAEKVQRSKKAKEITNAEVQILLAQYATIGPGMDDDRLESFHNGLCGLSEIQMAVIRLKYWEGRGLRESGFLLKISHEEVRRILTQSYEVLKAHLQSNTRI